MKESQGVRQHHSCQVNRKVSFIIVAKYTQNLPFLTIFRSVASRPLPLYITIATIRPPHSFFLSQAVENFFCNPAFVTHSFSALFSVPLGQWEREDEVNQ